MGTHVPWIAGDAPLLKEGQPAGRTVASGVGGTLTGDRKKTLDRRPARLHRKRAAGELYLIVSDGRRPEQGTCGIPGEGPSGPDGYNTTAW
jgi:hypothetical protein